MKKTVHLFSAIAFQLTALATTSYIAVGQNAPATPQPTTTQQNAPDGSGEIIIEPKAPNTPPRNTQPNAPTVPPPRNTEPNAPIPQRRSIQNNAPTAPGQTTAQRICASNSNSSIEDLLPPPAGEQINSPLSYLGQQGFTQDQDGSWVCYVSDAKKQGRYYTLFKVQQVNKKLVASSFLDQGALGEGQDNRSLDFFMNVIENSTKTNQGNRQSIRRYLDAFISLVKQGKIQPSNRGYLFDQPNRGFVIYHSLNSAKLKGTAITINVDMYCKSGSCPTS